MTNVHPPIQGVISSKTGLFPALKEIVARSGAQDGILRIEDNGEITGEVALTESRYITGAYVSGTGAKGVDALRRLLAVRKGNFRYVLAETGFDQNLRQPLKLDVKKLMDEDEEEAKANSAPAAPAAPVSTTPNSKVASAPNENAFIIPQFNNETARTNVPDSNVRREPVPKTFEDADGVPNVSQRAPIQVSKTKADISGQFIYADLPQEDDLFSLLEHFGLSVDKPLVERMYDDSPTLSPRPAAASATPAPIAASSAAIPTPAPLSAVPATPGSAPAIAEPPAPPAASAVIPNVVEPEPAAFVEPEPAAVVEPEAAQIVELQAAQIVEPEAAQIVEPEPISDVEPEAAQIIEPEPAQIIEPETAQIIEPEPISDVEPEVADVVEPETAHVVEPEPAHVVEPEVADVVEPEPEHVAGPETGAPRSEILTDAEPEPAAIEPEPPAFVEPEVAAVVEQESAAVAAEPPSDTEPVAETASPIVEENHDRSLPTPMPTPNEPAFPPATQAPAQQHAFERIPNQLKPLSGFSSFDPHRAANKFEQSETGKIETFKPRTKLSELPKSDQQKKVESDAEKKAKDPFEKLKEKYKKAQAAAEATWGAIAGDESIFPVAQKRRKSDDTKASMTGMVPAQPNAESAPPVQPAEADQSSQAEPTGEEREGAISDFAPDAAERLPLVNETVQVGSWAERVLSRKKGDTDDNLVPLPKPIEPVRSNPVQAPASSTASGSSQSPSKDESWADRVIAASRKAKGTAQPEPEKIPKSTAPATPKTDVDQSSSMRLKFHGNAPQPALPERIQHGSSSFWSVHREKINLVVVVGAVCATSFILGRVFMAGVYAHRAEDMLKQKQYENVLRDANTALWFDSGQEIAHLLKAKALSRLGQDGAALAEYNLVLVTSPNRVEALERRAASAVSTGNYTQALADSNKLLQLRPDNPMTVYANRGVANFMLGDRNAAVRDFTTALQMKPNDADLLEHRAASYREIGETDKSIADYNAVLKINPKNASAILGRAQTWLQAKNYDRAFADFNAALALNPKSPEVLVARGAAYTTTKQYDKATDDFAQALAINPRFADAYRERGRLNILQNQLWQAEDDLNHAAQQKADSSYYKQRAELDRATGNHDKAVEDFNQALVRQPYDVESYIGRARDRSDQGDQRSALADIDTALKIDPNMSELHALRGLYGQRYGNSSTAKADFDKALWLDHSNADAHLWRGEYLMKQRDFSGAIEDFNQALKSNPDMTEAKQQKSAALAALKQKAAK